MPQTDYLWAVLPLLWAKSTVFSTITSEGRQGEATKQSNETRSSLEGAAVAPEHVAIALEEGVAFETSSSHQAHEYQVYVERALSI